MPSEEGFGKLDTLAKLPLVMHVGGEDEAWRKAMQRVNTSLRERDAPPTWFTIFEGEGHTPKSRRGKILFNALDSIRVRTVLQGVPRCCGQIRWSALL